MITMKEWMELVDYKITEGDSYGWSCYGPNSYQLSSWNGVQCTLKKLLIQKYESAQIWALSKKTQLTSRCMNTKNWHSPKSLDTFHNAV